MQQWVLEATAETDKVAPAKQGEIPGMSVKGKAYIAGAFEHPTRHAPDKTVAQLHAEVALGAIKDAGLTLKDVDGYFCSGDAPGPGPASMIEYMNLKVRHAEFDRARWYVLCDARLTRG